MKKVISVLLAVLAAIGITTGLVKNIVARSDLSVVYVDVGQGDCQIAMCDGQTMLIDGGTADKGRTVVAVLGKLGISYLDYVVCTHAHADHCGGLAGVLSVYDAGMVLSTEAEEDTEAYSDFKSALKSRGLEPTIVKPGDKYALGKSVVEVLGPIEIKSDDLNNTSIVLKITNGDNSFLFTGDAEYEEEKEIMSTNVDLTADVLKVGHHGSSGSSSYSFLREVMPTYAIIGVGKDNSYGHPHTEAMSRLRDVGAHVFRTDMQGDITVVSDGKNITVTTGKNHNGNTNNTEKTEVSYIGNINSKKLHRLTCQGLPEEHNRRYFSSKSEAIGEGYKTCASCKP